MHRFYRSPLLQLMIFLPATLGSFAAHASYVQTDLVSDIPGFATITDPLLINPWGMSFSPSSPFWTSNQGTNTATLYTLAGGTLSKVTAVNAQGFVGIPTTAGGPQGPTGQVNNTNTASFQITPGTTSGSNLTFESRWGFPPDLRCASLAHAHWNNHHCFTRRPSPVAGSGQGPQRSAEARMACRDRSPQRWWRGHKCNHASDRQVEDLRLALAGAVRHGRV